MVQVVLQVLDHSVHTDSEAVPVVHNTDDCHTDEVRVVQHPSYNPFETASDSVLREVVHWENDSDSLMDPSNDSHYNAFGVLDVAVHRQGLLQ